MQHTPVFKVPLLAQRIVLGRILVHIRVIVILASTQRNVLGIIWAQRIVLGRIMVHIRVIVILASTQRNVLGIITITGSTAPGTIIIVQGMVGIITTICIMDTTIVTTAPNHSTAIG
jgi:hypothetical protein